MKNGSITKKYNCKGKRKMHSIHAPFFFLSKRSISRKHIKPILKNCYSHIKEGAVYGGQILLFSHHGKMALPPLR
jgi:hypothetical protein